MSRYRNENGEFLMTASQMRLEDELDEMSRYDSYYDDEDNPEIR